MIKIALFSHSAAFNGAEKMLYQLGMELKKEGQYYPIVFLPTVEGEYSFERICQEQLETVPFKVSPWYVYLSNRNLIEDTRQLLPNVEQTAKQFIQQDIGLVICNTLTSVVPILAARKAGIPIILWIHGILDAHFIPGTYDLEQRLLFDRILMNLSTHVVCCSRWTQNYYKPYSFVPTRVIANWSEAPKKTQNFSKKSPFVCLNTFDANKGVMTLLKAVKLLKKQGYHFQLDLYGTGGIRAELEQFAKSNKLEEYVTFCGRTNDVDSVYRNCYSLIQPSDIESFGLTITEAMSHGRAVIAMNSGGPQDIVEDSKTGFLLKPRDEVALAEKMAYLLDHPEVAEAMGEAGQKRYERCFSPQRGSIEFHREIQQALEDFQEDDRTKDLLEDSLVNLLRLVSEGKGAAAAVVPDSCVPVGVTLDRLSYSRPIIGKRKYRVHCSAGNFTKALLRVAFEDWTVPKGSLELRVFQGGKLVAQGTNPLHLLVHDQWSFISLVPLAKCETGVVTIELNFIYEEGSSLLGVYEDCLHRGFLYKLMNRLHIPLKGMDALIVHLS